MKALLHAFLALQPDSPLSMIGSSNGHLRNLGFLCASSRCFIGEFRFLISDSPLGAFPTEDKIPPEFLATYLR